ncbi:ADP-ribosylation factor-like protein 5B [Holothuria leucospilota]|uniref:ADP-ribosylation factor-like protein 5B n=1 Tax=Holothuria leucospilota TaxID=206669 RepID=A0A9Q0YQU0_HOLLE|nr:ADP-ribosylation factor-like protein 5B [Holothuria leucospilota]
MITKIGIEGQMVSCVVDTGSQVTTISEAYFKEHLQPKDNWSLNWLRVTGANHLTVPFNGCVALKLDISGVHIEVIALIVPKEPAKGIPCLLGMNAIKLCKTELFKDVNVNQIDSKYQDSESINLLQFLQTAEVNETRQLPHADNTNNEGLLGRVTIPRGKPVVIPARQEVIIEGYCILGNGMADCQVYIEPLPEEQNHLPRDILVAKTLGTVRNNFTRVRMINLGTKDIWLQKGNVLANLHEVEVLQSEKEPDVKLIHTDQHTVQINIVQQEEPELTKRDTDSADQLPIPVNVNFDELTSDQVSSLKEFLQEHHDVFSQGDYDYGSTSTVRHEIPTAHLGVMEQRWVARLSNFQFDIQYRPGKSNANADALSRKPGSEVPTEVCSDDEDVHTFQQQASQLPSMTEQGRSGTETLPGFSKDDVMEKQNSDPVINEVKGYIMSGVRPTSTGKPSAVKSLLQQWNNLTVKDGLLFRKRNGENQQEVSQLVVPDCLKQNILQSLHDEMGHFAVTRTLALIQQRYYWPGMQEDVQRHCSECCRCNLTRPSTKKAPLVNIKVSAPLELVAIDFLKLDRSSEGYENVLVITDHFTKFAVAVPTRDQTAVTVARALWQHFFTKYGCPARILSDQGANFESRVVHELCKLYNIEKSRTTPYHPSGNGLCERMNRTLINMIRTLPQEKKQYWATYLPELTYVYNNTQHSSTKQTPFYLMFGRHGRLPIDFTIKLPSNGEQRSTSDWVSQHAHRLHHAHAAAERENTQASLNQKKMYDRKATDQPLNRGDRVLIRKFNFQGRHKLEDLWNPQPYIIVDQPSLNFPVYGVKPEHGNGVTKVVHRNAVKPCCIPVTRKTETFKNMSQRPTPSVEDTYLPTPLVCIPTGSINNMPKETEGPQTSYINDNLLSRESSTTPLCTPHPPATDIEQLPIRQSRRLRGLPPEVSGIKLLKCQDMHPKCTALIINAMGYVFSKIWSLFTNEEYKVIIVGLDNAGKTTILYQMTNSHQPNSDCHARLIPRYQAFKFVILVIDSTDRERLHVSKEELYHMLANEDLKPAAMLLYANKQDVKGSMTPAEISQHLNLTSIKDHKWNIQACCALTGEGLYQGLEWIASQVRRYHCIIYLWRWHGSADASWQLEGSQAAGNVQL